MNVMRFIFVFLFVWQSSWGMILEKKNEPEDETKKHLHGLYEKSDQIKKSNDEAICNTINNTNFLEQEAKDQLCQNVINASDTSQVWLNSVNNANDLPVKKKLNLFEYIIKQDRNIKSLLGDITREKELRVKLINYFTENIRRTIKKEKKIAKINNAIRLITSPDAFYFYRGTVLNGEIFDKETSEKIRGYFMSCVELTNNVIKPENITDNYVSFGFDRPFDIGFYTFATQILNTSDKIKKIAKTITINEEVEKINKIIINKESEKQKVEESEQETDLFIIDKDLVKKLIKTFFADCFSRAELPENQTETANKEYFFTYFSQLSYQFDDMKDFVFDTAIEGSFRGVLLSIMGSESPDITVKKIKNFEKLSGIFFQFKTTTEKAEWDVFFNTGFRKFKDLYQNDSVKLRKINEFEYIVHQIMTQSIEPVPAQPPSSWTTKLAKTILLSGFIFFLAYRLKHNQQLFTKYPILQKLFPFLYQQPVQPPQSLIRKLLPWK